VPLSVHAGVSMTSTSKRPVISSAWRALVTSAHTVSWILSGSRTCDRRGLLFVVAIAQQVRELTRRAGSSVPELRYRHALLAPNAVVAGRLASPDVLPAAQTSQGFPRLHSFAPTYLSTGADDACSLFILITQTLLPTFLHVVKSASGDHVLKPNEPACNALQNPPLRHRQKPARDYQGR
jgi:hypothetical protein